MNYRELLDLAAKAAGYKVYGNGKLFRIWKDSNVEWVDWNPLEDDGAALRLAVKLKLGVDTNWYSTYRCEFTEKTVVVSTTSVEEETHKRDPYAATRRAIVRAAAEIGRNME